MATKEEILALAGEPVAYMYPDKTGPLAGKCFVGGAQTGDIQLFTADQVIAARKDLEQELERERIRLAACGVVAMCDTPESAVKAREMHPDYRSASCDDVARRVDECMQLRQQLAEKDAEIVFQQSAHEQAQQLLLEQGMQLAAAQLQIQRYQEKIAPYPRLANNTGFFHLQEFFEEILAQPQDTTALEAMIAKAGEVMRERCWQTAQPEDSYQDEWFKAKADSCARIRALPGVTIGDLQG